MRLLYLAGIDGSGKTTIARGLVEQCAGQGRDVRYFYAQHQPILLRPLKWLARQSLLRRASPGGDYRAYSARKSEMSRRHRPLALLYAGVWLFEYVVATHLRLLRHRVSARELVVDRYYPDIAVNVSQTLDLSEAQMICLVERLGLVLPRPSAIFWVDLPEEIAYSRKSDIPSIDYLRERRRRYAALNGRFVMTRVEGDRPASEVLLEISRHIDSRLAA
jgi:dTMP kinase